ncbi:MAG: FAD-binding domain-containing protein [Akkermansiaceae bacterium]
MICERLEPSRSAALAKLKSFVPLAAEYSGKRNFDLGSGNHQHTSLLSPYIRTRLISEEEVTRAVLEKHSARSAEKFLQEIAWRTYWKGWLEMRPNVWESYEKSLSQQQKTADYMVAVSGQTGIDCFDYWTRELTDTGYLHNHARMWFASIWIFTLKLPWQLGADFFLTHLLDADPAANTLSWRWVAGLHTQGKHYLARASNISKFTNGRFNPVGQLNEKATPLVENESFKKQTLNLTQAAPPKGNIGHLIFPEDLSAPPSSSGTIVSTAAYIPPAHQTTPLVSEFLNGAVDDTLARTGGIKIQGDFQKSLHAWIKKEHLDSIVISKPTVGHTHDFISKHKLTEILPRNLHYFVRSWDRLLWPHATAGFFKLKKALPKIHASLAPYRKDDLFPHT